jgi:hypothetical protein
MNDVNSTQEHYEKAFENLIKKTAESNLSEQFTLLYDEHFFKYLPSVISLVNKRKMKMTYIFLPHSYQEVIQNNPDFYNDKEIVLPRGITSAVTTSRVVLNFLTGNSGSSKVRGALLNKRPDKGTRIIHCPKLSDEILQLIEISDFPDVHAKCELMAWALGNTETAVLKTHGPDNGEYSLEIHIGGWHNEPFISGGVVCENSWGNVLPGEAFWCPYLNEKINGTVCINGSAPGFLFEQGAHLILEFKDSILTGSYATPGTSAEIYLRQLENNASLKGDLNWNRFAELGIGMNPEIKALTGNALFDEKMAGTVHIALGDNIVFGHDNESHFHEDLVILRPTLLLDGRTVIAEGKVYLEELLEWRTGFKVPRRTQVISEMNEIMFHDAKIDISNNTIRRVLNKGGRIGYIEVFRSQEPNVALFLIECKKIIEENRDDQFFSLLKEMSGELSEDDLYEIIDMLVYYRMANLSSKA